MSTTRIPEAEAGFQRAVIELAQLHGWRVFHARPARTERGWRTAVSGDGVGWPDLLCVRGGRIVAAELKSARGRVSDAQLAWLDALAAAGVESHVFRPRDWKRAVAVLR